MGAKQIKEVRSQVEEILKNSPDARESDTLLFLKFHEKELRYILGSWNYEKLTVFLNGHSSHKYETISRSRRKIQEQGQYQSVHRSRRKRAAEQVREAASNDQF